MSNFLSRNLPSLGRLRHSRKVNVVRKTILVLVTSLVAILTIFPTTSIAAASCAPADHPGGDWPTFGRDVMNSRHQEHETKIGPLEVPTLSPSWSFSTGGAALGVADLNGTPIIADGCLYMNTALGDMIALNADTGEQVWRSHVEIPVAGLGGTFVSSPAHSDGLVIGLVNEQDKPFAIAYDATSGAEVWRSEPMVSAPGYYTNATPVVHDGMVVAGFSPEEGDPTGRGGFVLIDVRTGRILKRTWTIPDADWEKGFAGGGLWTAPAINEAGGFAYMGSGNPYSKKIEHPHTNAILQIDLKRGPTFGEIVGSLKGNIDQYNPVFRDLVDPICQTVDDETLNGLLLGNSVPCAQLDLDFGAPPNLFTDASGRLLIGDLQKSGVYHVGDAATMEPAWQATMGLTCPACNANATAWDRSGSIYGVGTPGGQMVSLSDQGATQWVSPVADGVHYNSTTSANGVIYTVDTIGNLLAFDSATGLPLLRRPTAVDSGNQTAAISSSGIAIARNTIYVAVGSDLIAYSLN